MTSFKELLDFKRATDVWNKEMNNPRAGVTPQDSCQLCGVIPALVKLHVDGALDLILNLAADMDWMRQTVHRAHHEGSLEECQQSTCRLYLDRYTQMKV